MRAHLSLTACIVVLVASVLMSRPIITVAGAAPQLLLISVVVLGFFIRNIIPYMFLAVSASVFARQTSSFFDAYAYAFLSVALIIFVLKERLVWPDRLGVTVMSVISVLLLHLFLEPHFILSEPVLFIIELVASGVIAILLFEGLSYLRKER